MNLRRFVIAVGLLAVAGSASAVDLKSLKKSLGGSESSAQSSEGVSSLGGLGGLALPGISGKTAGNAAGVLEYCVKRKKSGLQGILQGDGGQSFNLDAVSDKLKDKGCDYVLDNAGKLI